MCNILAFWHCFPALNVLAAWGFVIYLGWLLAFGGLVFFERFSSGVLRRRWMRDWRKIWGNGYFELMLWFWLGSL